MYQLSSLAVSAGRLLLKAFYPASCCFCAAPGEEVCLACLNRRLVYAARPECPKCKGVLRGGNLVHRLCLKRSALGGVLAVCLYEPNSAKLIGDLKYKLNRDLAPVLTGLLKERIASRLGEFDYCVPVPLSHGRNKWRGFNQSALLAQGLPLPYCDCLERLNDRPPQAKLSRSQRLTNLTGVFRARPGQDLKGKRILLVDDVMTTGSTLKQCAEALKTRGAKTVTGLVFARDCGGLG